MAIRFADRNIGECEGPNFYAAAQPATKKGEKHTEDALLAVGLRRNAGDLFVLADGLSGCPEGERASAAMVDAGLELAETNLTSMDPSAILSAYMYEANLQLNASACAGAQTTLCVALQRGTHLWYINRHDGSLRIERDGRWIHRSKPWSASWFKLAHPLAFQKEYDVEKVSAGFQSFLLNIEERLAHYEREGLRDVDAMWANNTLAQSQAQQIKEILMRLGAQANDLDVDIAEILGFLRHPLGSLVLRSMESRSLEPQKNPPAFLSHEDITTVPGLQKGDRFLMCTDGLTRCVSSWEMLQNRGASLMRLARERANSSQSAGTSFQMGPHEEDVLLARASCDDTAMMDWTLGAVIPNQRAAFRAVGGGHHEEPKLYVHVERGLKNVERSRPGEDGVLNMRLPGNHAFLRMVVDGMGLPAQGRAAAERTLEGAHLVAQRLGPNWKPKRLLGQIYAAANERVDKYIPSGSGVAALISVQRDDQLWYLVLGDASLRLGDETRWHHSSNKDTCAMGLAGHLFQEAETVGAVPEQVLKFMTDPGYRDALHGKVYSKRVLKWRQNWVPSRKQAVHVRNVLNELYLNGDLNPERLREVLGFLGHPADSVIRSSITSQFPCLNKSDLKDLIEHRRGLQPEHRLLLGSDGVGGASTSWEQLTHRGLALMELIGENNDAKTCVFQFGPEEALGLAGYASRDDVVMLDTLVGCTATESLSRLH